MNTQTETQTKEEKQIDDLIKLFEDYAEDIDINSILHYNDINDINDSDDLYETIQDAGGFEIDIIYYYKAMEYLSDNDNSLYESVTIASEMGISTENINSELLASLHASQKARDDFYSITDEIDEILSR
jgi:hypothetical protein